MLNCTWDDMEAESALSKLELPIEEQQKLRTYYLNLREEYRKARRTPGSQDPAPSSE